MGHTHSLHWFAHTQDKLHDFSHIPIIAVFTTSGLSCDNTRHFTSTLVVCGHGSSVSVRLGARRDNARKFLIVAVFTATGSRLHDMQDT